VGGTLNWTPEELPWSETIQCQNGYKQEGLQDAWIFESSSGIMQHQSLININCWHKWYIHPQRDSKYAKALCDTAFGGCGPFCGTEHAR